MRVTVSIDDELLDTAREMAAQRNVSLDRLLSDLIRSGLRNTAAADRRTEGFPVFKQRANAKPITLEMVQQAEEEDDQFRLSPGSHTRQAADTSSFLPFSTDS